ncbi:toprim domain-containing protein [Asaia spathodeae]|uniref:toprim domain-containing protein n=1 Tax=Asaia spathodeae TaxID=657016 RepID=UPI002FC37E91
MSKRRAFIPPEITAEIKARAASDIAGLADHFLLGEYPRRKATRGGIEYARDKAGRRTWTATTTGRFAGWVKDWRGHNRDAIDFIRDRMGCDFTEALHWLADRYGVALSDQMTAEERARRSEEYRAKEAARQAEQERQREQQERIDRAAHEAAEIVACAIVARLPAATSHPYAERKHVTPRTALYASEAITGRLHSSDAQRWIDKATAAKAGDLVIPMQDASGRVINVQTITPDGTKRFLMGGQKQGAFHVIPGIEPGFLVEGYATGLTVAEATGRAVFVAFDAGNLGAVAEIVRPRLCAVAADNDESRTGENKARATGLPVLLPPAVGHDWNDHAQAEGLADTAARLAEITRTLPEGCPDAMAARGVPLSEAEAAIPGHVRRWLAESSTYQEALPEGYAKARTAERKAAQEAKRKPDESRYPMPPAYLLEVSTGAGKSHATLNAIAGALRAGEITGSVGFACPTVKLAQEQAEAFRKIAPEIVCRVYRGMDQEDPDAIETDPETGKPWGMCRNLGAVKMARELDLSAAEAVCDAKTTDSEGNKVFVCPFRDQCGYRKQKAAQGVRVWFLAHAVTICPRPACMSDLAAMAVDETPETLGIGEKGQKISHCRAGWTLPEWLDTEARAGDSTGRHGTRDIDRARHVRSDLIPDLLAANGAGHLRRKTLERHGVESPALQDYIDAENRLQSGVLKASAERYNAPDTREQEAERLTCRKVSGMIVGFLLECKRLLDDDVTASGRIEVIAPAEDGKPWTADFRRVASIHPGFRVPTLILSATPSETLLRHRFPSLTKLEPIIAAAPFMHISQDVCRAWGKTALFDISPGETGKQEESAKPAAVRKLMARIRREIRPYRRVLVVAQKPVIAALRDHAETTPGGWPDKIATAHFNAVSGLNAWGPGPEGDGVDLVIVIGRLYPPALDIERQAEALTGEPIERIERDGNKPVYFPRQAARYLMADGSSRVIEDKRQYHPDETASALLHSSMTGEIVQAIGRARGVRRTEANPCRVLVLSDVPLPLPINELIEDTSHAPDVFEEMASVGGIVCEGGRDAGRLYHGVIWGSPGENAPGDIERSINAARTAITRVMTDRKQAAEVGYKAYNKDYSIGNVANLGRVDRGASLGGVIGNVAIWNSETVRPVLWGIPDPVAVTYQPAGKGKKPAKLWFDPSRLSAGEVRERMEAALGPLALFAVADGVAAPLAAADSNGAERGPRLIAPPDSRGAEAIGYQFDLFRGAMHDLTDRLGVAYDPEAEKVALRVVVGLTALRVAGATVAPAQSVAVAWAFDALDQAGKGDVLTYAIDHLASDDRKAFRSIMPWPGAAKRPPGQTRLEWMNEHYGRDLPAWASAIGGAAPMGALSGP